VVDEDQTVDERDEEGPNVELGLAALVGGWHSFTATIAAAGWWQEKQLNSAKLS